MVALCAGLKAQLPTVPVEQDFLVRSWRREHGLPDIEVRVLRTSQDGYLWVGTRAGMARFDGMQWRVWRKGDFPELASDECRDLIEDSQGNVDIVTPAGLTVLGPRPRRVDFTGIAREFSAFEFLGMTNSFPDWGDAYSVAEFEPGHLIVGSVRGFFVESDAGWEYPTLEPRGTYLAGCQHLLVTQPGICWVGHHHGLSRIERDAQGKLTITRTEVPGGQAFVHSLAEDRQGNLWAIAGQEAPQRGQLLRWSDGKWKPAWEPTLSNGPALFLFAASDGALWFPDGVGRLIRWFPEDQTRYRFNTGRSPEFATAMAEDHEGNLWVGTESSGLLCLQPRRIRTWTTEDGLPDNGCWAFAELPDGVIAIGTESGLCLHRADGSRVITEKDGLTRNEIRALTVDPEGRLWIGTHAGLNVLASNTLQRVTHSGAWFAAKTRVLCTARDGTVYVGSATGLHRLTRSNDAWTAVPEVTGFDVRAILEQPDGSLLLGTQGDGLHLWRPGTDQSRRLDAEEPSATIWVIRRDTPGVLWFATETGLACWQEDRRFTFTRDHGLPANRINTVEIDAKGNLWLGHDLGICRLERQSLFDVRDGRRTLVECVPYDLEDGLLGLEVNGQKSHPASLRLTDGRILFATTQGVAIFDPERPPDQTMPPPVVIEELRAGGQSLYEPLTRTPRFVSGQDPVRLPPGSGRIVEIIYTACTATSPENVRFEHRLEGIDPDWIQAGKVRKASYANLPPGRYQFSVRAINKHGRYDPQGATIEFALIPFVYQTLWFRGLLAFVVLSTAGLLWQWRARSQSRLHALEREAALSRQRARLAKDLHDGLGARLTQLVLLTGKRPAETATQPGAERLSEIADCSHDVLHALRDIIWVTHPAGDTIEGLAGALSELATRLPAAAGLHTRLDIPLDLPDGRVSPEQRQALLHATREAIHNVVRHAAATELRLAFHVSDGHLRLRVEDDGRGFTPGATKKAAPGGLGLDSMRERIETLGGRVNIDSSPGQGTRVEFDVPLDP